MVYYYFDIAPAREDDGNSLTAILAAILVVASVLHALLTFMRPRTSIATRNYARSTALLSLEIDVDQCNFGADDEVSIFIMSSAQASLINGDVYSNDERVEVMVRGEKCGRQQISKCSPSETTASVP